MSWKLSSDSPYGNLAHMLHSFEEVTASTALQLTPNALKESESPEIIVSVPYFGVQM